MKKSQSVLMEGRITISSIINGASSTIKYWLSLKFFKTYLHLLGIEADGGGFGNTLATSDT